MRNVKIAQRGSVLIGLIITMLIMGTLGTSMYLLTTTSTFGSFFSNKANRALLLAESGIRYAQKQSTPTGSLNVTLNGSADRITVSWTTDAGTSVKTVSSTGIADQGSTWPVQRKLTYVAGSAGVTQDGGPPSDQFGDGWTPATSKLATAEILGGPHHDVPTGEYRGSPPGDTTGRFIITGGAACVSSVGAVDRFYLVYDPTKYNFSSAWTTQGNSLSYDTQVKISATIPNFMAGLSFRVGPRSGEDYFFLGAAFAQGNDTAMDIAGYTSLPTKSDPYVLLWRNGEGADFRMIAYKKLTVADGVIAATSLFDDNVEDGEAKWNSTHPGWNRVTDASFSPTHSWKGAVTNSTATLTFWHNFNRDGNNGDHGYVEMTYDNGANWTEINEYTSDNSGQQSFTIPSSFLLKPNVQVRFRLRSTSNHSQPVWNVDDVDIKVNGVSKSPFPDNMEVDETKWNASHTGWSRATSRYNSFNHSWEGVLPDQHNPPDRTLTSVSFSLADYTASVTAGLLTSFTPLTLPAAATMTFNHKLTFTSGSNVQVQMCQGTSCPTGGTWNTIGSGFTSSVDSFSPVTIPITSSSYLSHNNVYVRFYLSTSNITDFPTWYIDDVKIQGPAELVAWSTLLARLNDKPNPPAGSNLPNGRVNEIEIFYGSPAANSAGGTDTPIDINRLANPRDILSWFSASPINTWSSTTDDKFTLASSDTSDANADANPWIWADGNRAILTGQTPLTGQANHYHDLALNSNGTSTRCIYELASGGSKEPYAVFRTNCYTTQGFNAASFTDYAGNPDRPEAGIYAFGNSISGNVCFDDFDLNFPSSGGGTPSAGYYTY
jgi:hypothetical protein